MVNSGHSLLVFKEHVYAEPNTNNRGQMVCVVCVLCSFSINIDVLIKLNYYDYELR